jgi:hypothetical protein
MSRLNNINHYFSAGFSGVNGRLTFIYIFFI